MCAGARARTRLRWSAEAGTLLARAGRTAGKSLGGRSGSCDRRRPRAGAGARRALGALPKSDGRIAVWGSVAGREQAGEEDERRGKCTRRCGEEKRAKGNLELTRWAVNVVLQCRDGRECEYLGSLSLSMAVYAVYLSAVCSSRRPSMESRRKRGVRARRAC